MTKRETKATNAEEEIDLDEILFPALCAMGKRFLKKCAELDAKQKTGDDDHIADAGKMVCEEEGK